MAEDRIDAFLMPATEQEAAAAIVRAIRRVYGSSDHGVSGVDQFRVENVHQFARRLLEQGVTAQEPTA